MILEFIIFILAFVASLLLAYKIGYSHGVSKTFVELTQILEESIEEARIEEEKKRNESKD